MSPGEKRHLPATLRPEPISQQTISAQLGDDTIRAGANAMIISTAAILLFMLVVFFGRNFVLMFLAVGAVLWLDMARIVRGQALSIRRQPLSRSG